MHLVSQSRHSNRHGLRSSFGEQETQTCCLKVLQKALRRAEDEDDASEGTCPTQGHFPDSSLLEVCDAWRPLQNDGTNELNQRD